MTAAWLDCDQEEVHLWPLGQPGRAVVHARVRARHFLVAMAGPVTSGAIVLAIALGLNLFAGAQFVWNPFGNEIVVNNAPRSMTPVLPAGGGRWTRRSRPLERRLDLRLVRLPELGPDAGQPDPRPAVRRRTDAPRLAGSTSVVSSRDSIAAPWTAHACAFLLAIVGLVRLVQRQLDGLTLIGLAVLIEYLVRTEARMLEDGGYFDDGVFGYDFSEGYTSLESGAPKVRPYRESALKRWRRRAPSCAASAGSPARPPRSGGWMKSSTSSTARGARP